MICPADHKHGETGTCYSIHKCRCEDCRESRREYAYWRRHSGKTQRIVDATGTRRRVQALNVLGWTNKALADRLGLTKQAVQRLAYRETVWNTTADRIAALYDELCMTIPAHRSYQAGVSKRTRDAALRKGWVGPLHWDDIDHDPEPVETGVSGKLRGKAVVDEAAWLLDAGEAPAQIIRVLGVRADSLATSAARHGMADVARVFGREAT